MKDRNLNKKEFNLLLTIQNLLQRVSGLRKVKTNDIESTFPFEDVKHPLGTTTPNLGAVTPILLNKVPFESFKINAIL